MLPAPLKSSILTSKEYGKASMEKYICGFYPAKLSQKHSDGIESLADRLYSTLDLFHRVWMEEANPTQDGFVSKGPGRAAEIQGKRRSTASK
jgi:hypothetical protein